ncbi:MAG: hypothetical protein ACRDJM_00085 [Actinomycetota bacterium]
MTATSIRTSRRLRVGFVRAVVVALAVAAAVSGPALRAERIPGLCAGFAHPGPTSFRCTFTHQGRHILAWAAGVNLSVGPNPTVLGPIPTPNAVSVIVQAVLAADPSVVVAQCTFHGSTGGFVPPLFAGPCIGGGPNSVPKDGEALICIARTRTHAVFGCLSTPDLDPIGRPVPPG